MVKRLRFLVSLPLLAGAFSVNSLRALNAYRSMRVRMNFQQAYYLSRFPPQQRPDLRRLLFVGLGDQRQPFQFGQIFQEGILVG